MTLFLRFWPYILAAVLGVGLGLVLANWSWSRKVERLKESHAQELSTTISTERESCRKAQQITEQTSENYQKDAAVARDELSRARKLFKAMPCAPIASLSTAGRDGTSGTTDELHSGNGVPTDTLLGFAGRCEETRLKLKACQAFVRKERE